MSNMPQAIATGSYDDELDLIDRAVRLRRESLSRAAMLTIGPGTKVRMKDREDLRPAYLRGLTGEVVRKGPVNLTIHFDEPESARRYRGGIRIPADFLEVIE